MEIVFFVFAFAAAVIGVGVLTSGGNTGCRGTIDNVHIVN